MPRKAATTPKNTTPATPAEVREWAAKNGFAVAVRGKLASGVREAFTEKTGREII